MSEDSEPSDRAQRTTSPMQEYSVCSIYIGFIVLFIGLLLIVTASFFSEIGSVLLDALGGFLIGLVASFLASLRGVPDEKLLEAIKNIPTEIESRTTHQRRLGIASVVLVFASVNIWMILQFVVVSLMELFIVLILVASTFLFTVTVLASPTLKNIQKRVRNINNRIGRGNVIIGLTGNDDDKDKREKETSSTFGTTWSKKKPRLVRKGSRNTSSVRRGTAPHNQVVDDIRFTVRNQVEAIRGQRRQATRHLELLVIFYGLVPITTGVLSDGFTSGYLPTGDRRMMVILLAIGVLTSMAAITIDLWVLYRSKEQLGLSESKSVEDNEILSLTPGEKADLYRNIQQENSYVLDTQSKWLHRNYGLTAISIISFIMAVIIW